MKTLLIAAGLLLAASPASASLTQRLNRTPTSCGEARAQAVRSSGDSLRLGMVTAGALPSRSVVWQGYVHFQEELANTYAAAFGYLRAHCHFR